MLFTRKSADMPTRETALSGRDTPLPTARTHFVNGRDLLAPVPDGMQEIVVAMGCFWGAERVFWEAEGVYVTQVGYAGGYTPNATYEEACSGQTGHTEVVRVVFDPMVISLGDVLKLFWESHDPTQGMRQGNDRGSQYRSAIYTTSDDHSICANIFARYFSSLTDNNHTFNCYFAFKGSLDTNTTFAG